MERARRRAARAAFCGAQRFWRQFPRAARLLRARSRRRPAPLSPPPPPASVRLRPRSPAACGPAARATLPVPLQSCPWLLPSRAYPIPLDRAPSPQCIAAFHLPAASTSDLDPFWSVQCRSISGSLAPHSLCFSLPHFTLLGLLCSLPFALSPSLSSSCLHPSIRVRGFKERREVVVTSAWLEGVASSLYPFSIERTGLFIQDHQTAPVQKPWD